MTGPVGNKGKQNVRQISFGKTVLKRRVFMPAGDSARKYQPSAPAFIPSKPIPEPSAHFMGGFKTEKETPDMWGANAWKLIPGMTGVGKGGFDNPKVVRRPNLDPTAPPPAVPTPGTNLTVGEDEGADIFESTNRSRGIQGVIGIAKRLVDGAEIKDLPKAPDLERVRKQTEDALRDNTWTPDERVAIAEAYREFYDRYTLGDDTERRINNWAIRAEYKRLYAQWQREKDAKDGSLAELGDGDFRNTYQGRLNGNEADYFGPGFIINQDENGFYLLQDTDDTWQQINASARTNPALAATLITKLAAFGSYGGAAEKYATQNVVFAADGTPIKARWTKDDEQALRQFLTDVSVQQAGGSYRSWDEILDETAAQNQELGVTPGYGEPPGGNGGYGGYGGGGGYGGNAGGVSYTDPNELKQLLNGAARARLGYALSDADVAAFIADYHQREAAFVNARIAGQDATQLDPENNAYAWIESHFRDQMGAQAGNNYIQQLAQFLMGGGFASGAIGS